ncbi:DinI-like family protein [Klebsiella variicola]|uniref:DinI-like family protein n=1 Tax=Klebsiella variicola TaxID=244366 RepID=UPI003CEB6EF9
MKVEITIDRQKKLPDGAMPALDKGLLRRLDQNFNNYSLVIRQASSDGLTVLGGMDGDKKRIEEILQNTWESADDWFC